MPDIVSAELDLSLDVDDADLLEVLLTEDVETQPFEGRFSTFVL